MHTIDKMWSDRSGPGQETVHIGWICSCGETWRLSARSEADQHAREANAQ